MFRTQDLLNSSACRFIIQFFENVYYTYNREGHWTKYTRTVSPRLRVKCHVGKYNPINQAVTI